MEEFLLLPGNACQTLASESLRSGGECLLKVQSPGPDARPTEPDYQGKCPGNCCFSRFSSVIKHSVENYFSQDVS